MEVNPYASPAEEETPVVPLRNDAPSVRQRYLNHEAAVQSIGVLYMLAAIIPVLAILFFLQSNVAHDLRTRAIVATICGLSAVLCGIMAYGLNRLQNWARLTAAGVALPGISPILILPLTTSFEVFSGYGLLAFLFAAINVFIFCVMLSRKGAIVCSPPYRTVIRATPHIRYEASVVVLAFLILLLLLTVCGIIMALFVH